MRQTKLLGLLVLFLIILQSALAENITKEKAESLQAYFEKNVTRLVKAGYPAEQFSDTVVESSLLFSKADYAQQIALIEKTEKDISEMVYLGNFINQTAILLMEASVRKINIEDLQLAYNAGIIEYSRGNFKGAKEPLVKTQSDVLALLENESIMVLESLNHFIISMEESGISCEILNSSLKDATDAAKEKNYAKIFVLSSKFGNINQSISLIADLKNRSLALKDANLNVARINDLIIEAETKLSSGNYQTVLLIYNTSVLQINNIYELQKEINNTKQKLSSGDLKNIDLLQAEFYLNQSIAEFELENYEKAKQHLNSSNRMIEELTQKYFFTRVLNSANERFNSVSFFKKYYLQMLFFCAFSALFFYVSTQFVSFFMAKGKLALLKKENNVVNDMMVKLQEDYFKDAVIDKDTYLDKFHELEKRRAHIEEEVPRLEEYIMEKESKFNSLKIITAKKSADKKKDGKNSSKKIII
ncbi:MAG: hypothetical protein V1859_01970 [archaeon]